MALYCPCSLKVVNDNLPLLKDFFETNGVPFNYISNILKRTGAVLSGSTILKVMNNELNQRLTGKDGDPYNPYDIDIFVGEKNLEKLKEYLSLLFDHIDPSSHYDYFAEEQKIRRLLYSSMPNITHVLTYSWIHPIQVIALKEGVDPREYIETFDYTFCQNYYDGVDIKSYHPQCVKTKRGFLIYNMDENPGRQFHRTLKYEARGYTIVNSALGPDADTKKQIEYQEGVCDYILHVYPKYTKIYHEITVGKCGLEYLDTLRKTNETIMQELKNDTILNKAQV